MATQPFLRTPHAWQIMLMLRQLLIFRALGVITMRVMYRVVLRRRIFSMMYLMS